MPCTITDIIKCCMDCIKNNTKSSRFLCNLYRLVLYGTIRFFLIFVPINNSAFLDLCASFVWKILELIGKCAHFIILEFSLLVQNLFKRSLSPFSSSLPKISFRMITINELLPCPSLFVHGNFPVNLTVKIRLDEGFTLNAPLNNN